MRNTRALAVPAAILSVGLVAGCGPDSSSSSSSSSNTSAAASSSGSSSTASSGSNSANAKNVSCPTENTRKFAKTRFATDIGLAAGTFHRYLWKPYQAGTFKKGADGRVMAIVKGAGTAALDLKLLKNAADNAKANPTLCKTIAQPLSDAIDKMSNIDKSALLAGNLGGLAGVESSLKSVMNSSKSQGVDINETTDESKQSQG